MDEPLSRAYAAIIDSQVERLLGEQRPDGSFQPEGAPYHLYDQYVAYPLALAFLDEGGPCFGDERVLDAIFRSGDAHAREMDAEGKWPLVTRGGNWGTSLDEWRMHFWQEALLLIQDRLDAARRARWDEALRRGAVALAEFVRDQDEGGKIDFAQGVAGDGMSPNHLAWYMLAVRRAGLICGEKAWVERADRLFADMIAGQNADGFWFEYGAPAVMYNYVSLLAVGIYLEHLGAAAPPGLMAAIERAMDAQLTWSYPDGAPMTEIDGRNRYRSGGQLILPAVCARWPRGASALRASARRLAVARRVGGQALAFLAETARYLHRHEQPDETPASLPTVWRGRGITAGWRRKGPWQAVLSGICPRQRSGRFLTDMAHLVGLYHNRLGLVAGGGSSKDDPQWATFTVSPADGGAPLWQPEAAELRMEQGEDSLLLRYGKSRAEVGVSLTTDAARIHFTLLSAAGSVTARLLRPLPSGARLCSPDGEAVLDIAQPVTVDCQAAAALVVEGAVYSLPAGARFVWPRMPFNPYSRDGKAESGEAFGAFEVTLDRRRPSQFIGVSAA